MLEFFCYITLENEVTTFFFFNSGLIRSIFETLCNGEVISEASVQSWVFEANPSLLEENLDSLGMKLLVWFNELVIETEQTHN